MEHSKVSSSQKFSVEYDKIEEAEILFTPSTEVLLNKSPNSDRRQLLVIWSLVTLLSNIWVVFSVILWPAFYSYPTGFFFVIDVLTEIWLVIDILSRIIIKKWFHKINHQIDLLHTKTDDSYLLLFFLLVISTPQYLMYGGILDDQNNLDAKVGRFYFTVIFKILRSFEISRTFRKAEKILYKLNVNYILGLKFVINILLLFFTVHFASCCWMFIAFTVHIPGRLPGYYERTDTLNAPLLQKYVDAATWAVSAMTGNSYGDVTPKNNEEFFLSIIIMAIGASTFAKIFSDFEYIISIMNREGQEIRQRFRVFDDLCKLTKVDESVMKKIAVFEELYEKHLDDLVYTESIVSLPESLKSEISVSVNKAIIPKCNLFNLGSPAFIAEIIGNCIPVPVLQGDPIVQRGDNSEDMYFLKMGELEVLAPDEKTVIAVLSPGAYFGEIGVLLDQNRTLTVMARTDSIVNQIPKDKFLEILERYPDQKDILYKIKVAHQRKKTSTVEDFYPKVPHILLLINKNVTTREQAKKFNESDEKVDFNMSMVNPIAEGNAQIQSRYTIAPFSKFYYLWSIILVICVLFEIFYVPIGLFFSYRPAASIIVIDVICLSVFLVDIIIHANTIIHTHGKDIDDPDQMYRNYISNELGVNIVAVIPFDYILLSVLDFTIGAGVLRLLRLLKIKRVYRLYSEIQDSSDFKFRQGSARMVFFVIVHIILNHYLACTMYAISNWEYQRVEGRLDFFQIYDQRSVVHVPLNEQQIWVKYITFLYWAYATSSGGSYGDLLAMTVYEKMYEIFGMLLFKVYLAFVSAELTHTIVEKVSDKWDYFDKISVLEEWATHIRIEKNISDRIKSYYVNLWEKNKGLNEQDIINDIPLTIKDDVVLSKYADLLENIPVFTTENQMLLVDILTKIRVVYLPKDEFIFREGEMNDEIYFIMDGLVSYQEGSKILTLPNYSFIGSIDSNTLKPNRHYATVKCLSSVNLACLSNSLLQEINEKEPEMIRQLRLYMLDQDNKIQEYNEGPRKSLKSIKSKDMRQKDPSSNNLLSPDQSRFLPSPEKTPERSVVKAATIGAMKNLDTEELEEPSKIFGVEIKNYRRMVLFLIFLMNFLFIPSNIAFPDELHYDRFYPIELVTLIVLLSDFCYKLRKKYIKWKKLKLKATRQQAAKKTTANNGDHKKNQMPSFFNGKLINFLVLEILTIIPFPLIFQYSVPERDSDIFLIAIQMIRLTRFSKLFYFFKLATKKMALMLMIQCLYIFFILNHLFACWWIIMGRRANFNLTWLAKLPAPQDSWPNNVRDVLDVNGGTIYLAGLYWSYVTTSHVGIGDVCSADASERVYGAIIFCCGTFLSVGVFGNIVSIAEKLAPIIKLQFQNNYKLVMGFIRSFSLETHVNVTEQYFNFLWEGNRGIDENKVLNELPKALKADVCYSRYTTILESSTPATKCPPDRLRQIFNVFWQGATFEVFLPGDQIIAAGISLIVILNSGQIPSKVYFLLEGEAEFISFDKQQKLKIEKGKFFGCIELKAMSYAGVRAQKICKLASLSEDDFDHLCYMYTDFAEAVRAEEEKTKLEMLEKLEYFDFMRLRSDDVKYVVDDELVKFYSATAGVSTRNIAKSFARKKETKFQKMIRTLIKEIRVLRQENPKITLQMICDNIDSRGNGAGTENNHADRKTKKKANKMARSKTTQGNFMMTQRVVNNRDLSNSKYYLTNNSNLKTAIVLIHVFFVIYTGFQLPIWVCYDMNSDVGWMVIEYLAVIDSIVFIIASLRTVVYVQGAQTVKLKHTLKNYYDNGMTVDVIGAIPFNLIFVYNKINPIVAFFFRLLRVLQTSNLRRDFDFIEGKFRRISKNIGVLKSLLVLLFVWHWTSSVWFFIDWQRYYGNNDEANWIYQTGIDHAEISEKWLYALCFTMSVATTTGYAEQRVYSDFERSIFIVVVYIGSAMFAIGFGLMSSSTQMFSEFFEENYQIMKKMQRMCRNEAISKQTLSKIQGYITFKMDQNFKGTSEYDDLGEIIPPTLVEDLAFERVKDLLLSFKVMSKLDSYLKTVAFNLRLEAFVPMDYIFHKGDKAEAMYFIMEGTIGLFDNDDITVSHLLGKNDFYGETCIFREEIRENTAIALNHCIIAVLEKQTYRNLIETNPALHKLMLKEMKLFRPEMTVVPHKTEIIMLSNQPSNLPSNQPSNQPSRNASLKQEQIIQENEQIKEKLIEPKKEGEEKPHLKLISLVSEQTLVDIPGEDHSFHLIPISKSPSHSKILGKSFKDSFNVEPSGQKKVDFSIYAWDDTQLKLHDFKISQKLEFDEPPLASENMTRFNSFAENKTSFVDNKTSFAPEITLNIAEKPGEEEENLLSNDNIQGKEENPENSEIVDPTTVNRREIVEENELTVVHDKPSKRLRPRYPFERRYSRISLIQDLAITRAPGIHLRWGMNLD